MSIALMNTDGGSRIRSSSGSMPWSPRLDSRSAPGINFPGLWVMFKLYCDIVRFHLDCLGVRRRAALKYVRFLWSHQIVIGWDDPMR